MVAVEQDHPGAGAEDRPLEAPDRLLDPVEPHQPRDRGRLAAGDDQAVEAVELLGLAHLDRLGAEAAQHGRVLAEVALDGQDADAGCRSTARFYGRCDRRFSISAVAWRASVVLQGEVHILRRIILAAGLVALLAAVAVTVAVGAKPGNGQSTGSGTVFLPNPVADLQNQSLTDQKDADYPALAPAYHRVTLDEPRRQRPPRRRLGNIVSETGDPAYSPTNEFNYRRNDDRFEQVMAYYWVTEAQKYIQCLGFGTRCGR